MAHTNCRLRLKHEGKPYPRSGCAVSGCDGVFNTLCNFIPEPETGSVAEDVLRDRLAEARRKFPYGSLWRHTEGGLYQVKGVALDKATLKPVVLYERERILWTWPAEDFERRFTVS